MPDERPRHLLQILDFQGAKASDASPAWLELRVEKALGRSSSSSSSSHTIAAMVFIGVCLAFVVSPGRFPSASAIWQGSVIAAALLTAAGLMLLLLGQLWVNSSVSSESLIVINNVGIQLVSTRRAGWSSQKFLEMDRIQDVIIYEALTATEVRTVLGFILADDAKTVTIAFEGLLPGLDVLRKVYSIVYSEIHNNRTSCH